MVDTVIPLHSDALALIDSVLSVVVAEQGSDLHFEPYETTFRIRMRRDGLLQTIYEDKLTMYSAIVNRFKILGSMDIAERRKPQDGGFTRTFAEESIDFRLSIVPTMYGEKIALRVLVNNALSHNPHALGYTEEQWSQIKNIADRGQGLFVFTGPTGSGKTTTMYTLLQHLNEEKRHIITLEDPVEYRIQGINQMQTNERVGLTFSNGLRSILRQDPEVIMVGEIRDKDTAEIAIRAAITGHLVLTTLHTQDSFSAIIRLRDMGIEPYLIAAALHGISSQRLVRRLCTCKKEVDTAETDKMFLESLGFEQFTKKFEPKGCEHCVGGYRGRMVVSEVLIVDAKVRRAILQVEDVDHFRMRFPEFRRMIHDGLDKCAQGFTSLEEVYDVIDA